MIKAFDIKYYSGLAGTYFDFVPTTFTLTKKTEFKTTEEFDAIIEKLRSTVVLG